MATANLDYTPQDISPVDAIWSIIQNQSNDVRQAIFLRVESERKESKAKSELLLKQLKDLPSGPAGFLQLSNILPPSKLSTQELLSEALKEKFGV